MGKNCQAPEDVPGLPQRISDQLGDAIDLVAENKIFEDYGQQRSTGAPSTIFPNRFIDGTQIFRDSVPVPGELNNTKKFINFLKANNPQIDEINLFLQMNQKGAGIKNPDWMTHRPARSEFEFYEVKPNSASGRAKGPAKILFLIALCGSQRPPLPYVPGTLYFARDKEEPLWIEIKGFIQTDITLQWSRTSAGLILYKVCIETKMRELAPQKAKSAVDAAALLLMMLILAGLKAGPELAI